MIQMSFILSLTQGEIHILIWRKEENGYFEKVIKANFVSSRSPVLYDMNASIYVYETNALISKEPTTFFNERDAMS